MRPEASRASKKGVSPQLRVTEIARPLGSFITPPPRLPPHPGLTELYEVSSCSSPVRHRTPAAPNKKSSAPCAPPHQGPPSCASTAPSPDNTHSPQAHYRWYPHHADQTSETSPKTRGGYSTYFPSGRHFTWPEPAAARSACLLGCSDSRSLGDAVPALSLSLATPTPPCRRSHAPHSWARTPFTLRCPPCRR